MWFKRQKFKVSREADGSGKVVLVMKQFGLESLRTHLKVFHPPQSSCYLKQDPVFPGTLTQSTDSFL